MFVGVSSPNENEKLKPSNKSNKPTAKGKKKNKNVINDEKGKKEAKSRLAAIRKQGKLRQQEEADSIALSINGSLNKENVSNMFNNNVSLESSENGSLNSSFNADASLNSSLNSSLEGLYDNITCDNHLSTQTAVEGRWVLGKS